VGRRTVPVVFAFALAASTAPGGDSQPKPDRGRTLVLDLCSTCHEVERIKKRALTREGWAGFIKGMLAEGAAVTDEEFGLIVDYLAKNFGVEEKK